jgi:hypothetical protein
VWARVMLDWRWTTAAAVLAASAAFILLPARGPAAPIVAGREFGPKLGALEAKVNAEPRDFAMLLELANEYLDHGAPGLAQAALDRAPAEVANRAAILDARARALAGLGMTHTALSVQRAALLACDQERCSRALWAHAKRRAGFLEKLARLGVESPEEQPERTFLAYRLSVREVRLNVD